MPGLPHRPRPLHARYPKLVCALCCGHHFLPRRAADSTGRSVFSIGSQAAGPVECLTAWCQGARAWGCFFGNGPIHGKARFLTQAPGCTHGLAGLRLGAGLEGHIASSACFVTHVCYIGQKVLDLIGSFLVCSRLYRKLGSAPSDLCSWLHTPRGCQCTIRWRSPGDEAQIRS